MVRILIILAGGGLGSVLRYGATVTLAERFGQGFPWGTAFVNVAGSFLIGLIAVLADEVQWVSPTARFFLVVGVLGGFTTFSTFSLDTLRMLEHGEIWKALTYVLGSVTLTFVAVFLGAATARFLS